MKLDSTNLSELNHISKKIGQNITLVQGAGGNTSFKNDGVLWVKASGKWLAQAEQENIFVAVDLEKVCDDIKHDVADPVSRHVLSDNGLRPSIETTLHALLPQRVVLHVHSINAIAWAVNKKGESLLEKLLTGLKWAWVPYCKPGINLTHAVKAKLTDKPDILILGNHGLVVGADTFAEAEKRLAEVEKRLQRLARNVIAPDDEYLKKIQQNTGWHLPLNPEVHSLATDPLSFQLAMAGAMYPDHVVFLKAQPFYLIETDLAAATQAINSSEALYVLIKDKGVLVNPKIATAAQQMLLCQALILLRVQANDDVQYLNDNDVDALLNWEAEKYRQQMV
jgi:rhamnose utilization protein RhaD (predicted bifunctional aldolase and dehydrogenase)